MFHVGILTGARESDHECDRHVRFYNPANECENFPFGEVGEGRFLTTLSEAPAFELAEALDIAEFWHGTGATFLFPAN